MNTATPRLVDEAAADAPLGAVAVRTLCDFAARRGDLDLRFTPSPVHDAKQIDHLVCAMDALWGHCALNRAEMAG